MKKHKKANKRSVYVYHNNGDVDTWRPDEYTNYYYDGKLFVVIYKKQWVGIYPLGEFERIVVV